MSKVFVLILFWNLILCCTSKSTESTSEPDASRLIDNMGSSAESRCEEGRMDARQDIDKGDLGYYFYGLPNPRFNTFVRVARDELSLKIKGGGDITLTINEYTWTQLRDTYITHRDMLDSIVI